MKKLALFAMTIALLAWHVPDARARSKRAKGGPLHVLSKVGRVLQTAGTAALRGKTTASKKQLKLRVRSRAVAPMKRAGVRSLQLVGFEYELLFHQGTTATYYLRTFVHATSKRVQLMHLSGRKSGNGKMYVTGVAPRRFTGFATGFRLAAQRLLRSAKTARCRNLAVVNAGLAKNLGVPARYAKRLARDAKRSAGRRAAVCRDLAGLRRHKMTIRVDDVAYLALDSRGRVVGLVKAELDWRRRKLELTIKGFRPIRP